MSAIEYRVRAGKYLMFELSGEHYGIDAMRVVAIIGIQPITPLPQAPRHVKGLTMVRGKVVPVIDVRLRLGMPEAEETAETCIILLSAGSSQTGIIVDRVHNVVDIADRQFEDLNEGIDTDGILGIARLDKTIVTILSVDDMITFSGTGVR